MSRPLVNFSITESQDRTTVSGERVLIVGQAHDLTASTLVQNAQVEDYSSVFGSSSHITYLADEFLSIASLDKVDLLGYPDPAGGAASFASITFAGTATANANLEVSVVSATKLKKIVPITLGDTAENVATKVAAAFSGVALFVAAVDGTDAKKVNFTAIELGTLANNWPIAVDGSVAGVTFTLAGFSGGTGEPDTTTIGDLIGDQRYNTIVFPGLLTDTTILEIIDSRFNYTNKIRDGVLMMTRAGSAAARASDLGNYNSQSLVIFNVKTLSLSNHVGPSIVEMPDWLTSQIAAIRSLRLTEGALISDYVSASMNEDQQGGMHISSLPYFNTPLNGDTPSVINMFTDAEVSTITSAGGSCIVLNDPGTSLILDEVVTTRTETITGVPDETFKYLNIVDEASKAREYKFNNYKARFAQSRKSSSGTTGGFDGDVVTVGVFAAFDDLLFSDLVERGIYENNIDYYRKNRKITDIPRGYRVETKPPLIGQLREIFETLEV